MTQRTRSLLRASCLPRKFAIELVVLLLLISRAAMSLPAQDAQQPADDQPQQAQPSALDQTLAILHGVVRNSATGEGIPRALVSVEGDANAGALTDGEGRFEIPNIPVGPQAIDVRKPGFRDFSNGGGAADQGDGDLTGTTHNVLIAASMPDVVFTLSPLGSIRGQVELSTGDVASGINLFLAHRVIQGGRVVWQQSRTTKTRSDGTYRFGLLAEGDYAIFTEPTLDTDLDAMPSGGGSRSGFAAIYYPDARDPSGIGRLHVATGQETQANFSLTLEPFQAVSATVVFPPGSAASRAGAEFSATVFDSSNRPLPYRTEYDADAHEVRVSLPDGTYTLLVSEAPNADRNNREQSIYSGVMVGATELTVAGRPVNGLRIPVAVQRISSVQINLRRNTTAALHTGPVSLLVSPAEGWIDDTIVSEFANGNVSGPLEPVYTRPGAYWVRTQNQAGLCVDSVNAGGADLAREPLIIGLSGTSAPIELNLRDDCASLQLSLPDAQTSINAGEEPFYTVYVVPDFASTAEIQPATLRASTGGTMTIPYLAPGNYLVYTFAGSAQIPYRNRGAMAAMKIRGQTISLAPGSASSLVVEVPAQ